MTDTCGAKTRSGGECKKPPLKGKTRCKLHGGASIGAPIGSSNAKTHGIYQKRLTKEEQEDYNELELGAVDHELRLTRIMLGRALDAEIKANDLPELEEITKNSGGGDGIPYETKKSKRRDYSGLIDRLTSRIESLEKTRLSLSAASSTGGQNVDGFEVVEYED